MKTTLSMFIQASLSGKFQASHYKSCKKVFKVLSNQVDPQLGISDFTSVLRVG